MSFVLLDTRYHLLANVLAGNQRAEDFGRDLTLGSDDVEA
jgi:hypothetical protein